MMLHIEAANYMMIAIACFFWAFAISQLTQAVVLAYSAWLAARG